MFFSREAERTIINSYRSSDSPLHSHTTAYNRTQQQTKRLKGIKQMTYYEAQTVRENKDNPDDWVILNTGNGIYIVVLLKG